MDSLDDIDSTSRRSRQVRSWYLYEQYKSLEKNQLEAARQLHDKTSQHALLHRELSAHRQRRQMYSECQSEPSAEFLRHGDSLSAVTGSINDLFDNFCQEHDEGFPNAGETDATSFQDSCLWSQDEKELCIASEKFKTKDNESARKSTGGAHAIPLPRLILKANKRRHSESNNNLADDEGLLLAVASGNRADDKPVFLSISSCNFADDGAFYVAASSGNLADDIKEELEYVKRNIVENIHLQLEIKENVQSLESFTKPQDSKCEEKVMKFGNKLSIFAGEKDVSDRDSLYSLLHHSLDSEKSECKYNMFALWAKLVSFSYQVVQLNHGNCYYDYSSLLMTAVLACDVIRRGIAQMCNVLQPYVSPIKFVSNCAQSNPSTTIKKAKNIKTALSQTTKKSNKGIKYQRKHMRSRGVNNMSLKSPSTTFSGEIICRTDNMHSFDNSVIKMPLLNEAWQSVSTYHSVTLPSEKYSSTWHEELNSKSSEFNSCCTQVSNPMLKLATYIDSIIEDIDNSNL